MLIVRGERFILVYSGTVDVKKVSVANLFYGGCVWFCVSVHQRRSGHAVNKELAIIAFACILGYSSRCLNFVRIRVGFFTAGSQNLEHGDHNVATELACLHGESQKYITTFEKIKRNWNYRRCWLLHLFIQKYSVRITNIPLASSNTSNTKVVFQKI